MATSSFKLDSLMCLLDPARTHRALQDGPHGEKTVRRYYFIRSLDSHCCVRMHPCNSWSSVIRQIYQAAHLTIRIYFQDHLRHSLAAPAGATPQKREFFSRMSADGVSPASLRAARITETDLQEAEESEPKATLGGIARQVQKARSS